MQLKRQHFVNCVTLLHCSWRLFLLVFRRFSRSVFLPSTSASAVRASVASLVLVGCLPAFTEESHQNILRIPGKVLIKGAIVDGFPYTRSKVGWFVIALPLVFKGTIDVLFHTENVCKRIKTIGVPAFGFVHLMQRSKKYPFQIVPRLATYSIIGQINFLHNKRRGKCFFPWEKISGPCGSRSLEGVVLYPQEARQVDGRVFCHQCSESLVIS